MTKAANESPSRPRVDFRSEMRCALRRNELFCVYQPVVDLGTGRAVGVEALLRWRHPQLGVVLPGTFIPALEGDELIVAVGRWVLLHALRDAAQWRGNDSRLEHLTAGINIPVLHLEHVTLTEHVSRALDVTSMPASSVVLEITESRAIRDLAAVLRPVRALQGMHVRIALDDFGTGYWNLDHLATLRPDMVKVDRRFVRGLSDTLTGDGLIAEHILRLANSRAIVPVAEGVEDPAQVRALLDHDCHLAQGFLFAHPMPAAEAGEWLSTNATTDTARNVYAPTTKRGRAMTSAPTVVEWPPELEAKKMRLLLVEDSPSDAFLLHEQLHDDTRVADATVDHVTTLHEALASVADRSYDAVLLDLGLPDCDGLDSFQALSAVTDAAIVVITGRDDARLAEEAVRLGAQDYLVKSDADSLDLARAISYAIRRQHVLFELQRARDEQLAAKDRFLSHVSHELRSPLAVVHQFASLLFDGCAGPLTAEQLEFLTVLMRNVGQLRVMIDDLLEVSRAQHGRLGVETRLVALESVLNDAAAAYRPTADDRHITLTVDAHAPACVIGDPERIREVLANLVDNALKFTPPGGSVHVGTDVIGDYVRIDVVDNGRGIRSEDVDRIFEQFFQSDAGEDTSRTGLGLGLFVSRDLIRRQGGQMWAESALGEGTTLSFTLPRADHEETP